MITIINGLIITNIDPPPKIISTIIEAIATGTDIKKLNLRALSWSYFSRRIDDTVTPEREIPGKIENPWISPETKLSFLIKFSGTFSIVLSP